MVHRSTSCPNLSHLGDPEDPFEVWKVLKSLDHLSIHYASGGRRSPWDESSWPQAQPHSHHLSCSDKLVVSEGKSHLEMVPSWPSEAEDGQLLDACPTGRIQKNGLLNEISAPSSMQEEVGSDIRILFITGCLLSLPLLGLIPILPCLLVPKWSHEDDGLLSQEVAAVPSRSDLVSMLCLSCVFLSAALLASVFSVHSWIPRGIRRGKGLYLMGCLVLNPFIALHYHGGSSNGILIPNYLILGGLALSMVEYGQLTWLMDLAQRRRRKTLVLQHYLISRQGLGHILCGLVITLTLWVSSSSHGVGAKIQGGPLPFRSSRVHANLTPLQPHLEPIHPNSSTSDNQSMTQRPRLPLNATSWNTLAPRGASHSRAWNTFLASALISVGCGTILTALGAICTHSNKQGSEQSEAHGRKCEKEAKGNLSSRLAHLNSNVVSKLIGRDGEQPFWSMMPYLGTLHGCFYFDFLKPSVHTSLGLDHLGPMLAIFGTAQILVFSMLGGLIEAKVRWKYPLTGAVFLFQSGTIWITLSLERLKTAPTDPMFFYALTFVWGFILAFWDFVTLTHFQREYQQTLERGSTLISAFTSKRFQGLAVIPLLELALGHEYGRIVTAILFLLGHLELIFSYVIPVTLRAISRSKPAPARYQIV